MVIKESYSMKILPNVLPRKGKEEKAKKKRQMKFTIFMVRDITLMETLMILNINITMVLLQHQAQIISADKEIREMNIILF